MIKLNVVDVANTPKVYSFWAAVRMLTINHNSSYCQRELVITKYTFNK